MTFSLEHLHRCSVAVDLGGTRTRVHLRQHGVIVNEPSVAAVDNRNGALIAVGAPAERMDGRTPAHIRIVRPICGGTVVDIDMARRMLRALAGDRLRRTWRRRPLVRAAVCVPHLADPLAQRAAIETLTGLGAKRVVLVDTLITAAVGCGLPVTEPEATMIAVCGAASTQVAVLAMGAVVAAETVPVGGDSIDQALVQHLRMRHGLMLRCGRVRSLQLAVRGADGREGTEVHGRDVTTGRPRSVRVDQEAVQEAVQAPLTGLLDAIRSVLQRCPPDLVADLADRGVTLAGGSARLPGLDTMLGRTTGMPVHVAEEPDLAAVRGLGAMVEGRVRPVRLDSLGC